MRRRPRWTAGGVGLAVVLAWTLVACTAPSSGGAPPAPAAAPAAPNGPGGSAAPGVASPGPLPAPLKIRMGSVNSLGDGPLYVAYDRGYFTEAGLDVEDVRFDVTTRMMQPF